MEQPCQEEATWVDARAPVRSGEVIQDIAFSDLTSQIRERLKRSEGDNFFNSLGYSEIYATPPAQRVCFVENGSGQIGERCFYRERVWAKWLGIVDILGPLDADGKILRHLQRVRKPAILSASFLTADQIPASNGGEQSPRVRKIADDSCIELPSSPDEYLRRLGSKTRKHLPYYVRRLERTWGDRWTFTCQAGAEIPETTYRQLMQLNAMRMERRGRASLWSDSLINNRWRLMRESGLLGGIFLEGRLVAGTLSLLQGKDAYLIVIAHDPEFDQLNLGNVGLWLTIQMLIDQGVSRYHLLWGKSFYKDQFGGKEAIYYKATYFSGRSLGAISRIADFTRLSEVSRVFRKGQTVAQQGMAALQRIKPGRRGRSH